MDFIVAFFGDFCRASRQIAFLIRHKPSSFVEFYCFQIDCLLGLIIGLSILPEHFVSHNIVFEFQSLVSGQKFTFLSSVIILLGLVFFTSDLSQQNTTLFALSNLAHYFLFLSGVLSLLETCAKIDHLTIL